MTETIANETEVETIVENTEMPQQNAAPQPTRPVESDDTVIGNMGMLMDIDMKVTVELGRTQMKIRDIMELSPGSIVELGKSPSEPVDIMVNGVLTARGEVVVVDEHFAVRVTRLIERDDRGRLR